jgi:hypothetical protein
MPGPVSLTLRNCSPRRVTPTRRVIVPPVGVNLIALEIRFRQIWRTERY